MKSNKFVLLVAALLTLNVAGMAQAKPQAAAVDYLQFKPLTETLKGVKLQPVKEGVRKLPMITWPGDVSTITTDMLGIFKSEGLNVELFVENDFAKQVTGVLQGDTPYLRCTVGMCNAAADVFKNAGTNLYLIYQLTWSNGGDVLVVKPGINSLADLKGKTIGLQLYGPHMDYLTTILAQVGLKPSDVKIKWLKELTIPTYETNGKAVDPRTAKEQDDDLDAVFVISPDAAALTGAGGSGGESVKGSKILVTSAQYKRVIADTYAVRADWFEKHTDEVNKLVHALMLGQEKFEGLLASKASDPKYTQVIAKSAELLFGSPSATGDVEGSLADCEWVGFSGNVEFFTGAGSVRNFDTLSKQVQTSFVDMGLLKAPAPLKKSSWDYAALAKGLTNADVTNLPVKAAFDEAKVRAKVEKQIATELDTYTSVGVLPPFEIYFDPKQTEFDVAKYVADFERALDQSQTAGGLVFIIEGHNAPDLYNKRKAEGASTPELAEIEQVALNLSKQRSDAVKASFLKFCTDKGVNCDATQFVTVGLGVSSPKFKAPTKAQWPLNRRVVFRPKVVETELEEFTPPSK
ncbi:MAG: ABC transporter substrate-binding protein [Candidatus Obscuribacter sp.]|jgi:ABC-type nitrate/sulfonate/bicarbonate transport system substrate-binding protein/outer membrane protein OmpA-like peptidoglycan-associated protein|nr:ABC transporter substrate-binding protein [Candidatus Obscuribacter sp.]MBP6592945.1 ABC transporter substrate-binding protein [Candidatus Obscuribacter sp.]MBP7576880.1 ABC transporter substrate-binding protein [Candidatus Obscuribacter sp.]